MEQKLRRDRNIGDNLRKLRNQHDLSQEKLCAKLQLLGCDISRTTYEKYEFGKLNVRISVLIALKKIYGCTFDDFFLRGLMRMIDDAVRTRIRELLKEQKKKLSKVALVGGLTPSTLYAFMRGTTAHIQLNTLKQVCMGFDISMSDFFNRPYFDDYE